MVRSNDLEFVAVVQNLGHPPPQLVFPFDSFCLMLFRVI